MNRDEIERRATGPVARPPPPPPLPPSPADLIAAGMGVPRMVAWAQTCYDMAVVNPLERLYLFGPTLCGYGFWGGRAREDICASLSNTPSAFWAQHAGECDDLIARNFNATLVAAESIIYVALLYGIVSFATEGARAACHRLFARARAPDEHNV